MKKRIALLAALALLVSSVSAAEPVCPDVPEGPGLVQLLAVCDYVKQFKPGWVKEDCALFFMKLGARDVHAHALRQAARELAENSVRSKLAAFDAALPLPSLTTSSPTGE